MKSTPFGDSADIRRIEPRASLAAQGSAALRELILGGVLAPGARLNEVELSAALGISRAPLREAIRELASQGLLTTVTHRGAFVPDYTEHDLRDLYDVRIALETHAVRLLSTRSATQHDLADLVDILDAAAEEIDTHQARGYPDSLDFHRCVVAQVGNSQLSEMATSIDQKVHLARIRSSHVPQRAPEALRQHRLIVQSVADRDADRAVALMTEHLQASLANALGLIGTSDSRPGSLPAEQI